MDAKDEEERTTGGVDDPGDSASSTGGKGGDPPDERSGQMIPRGGEPMASPGRNRQHGAVDWEKTLMQAIEATINADLDTLIGDRDPREAFQEIASLGRDGRIYLNRLEGKAVGTHTSALIKMGAFFAKHREVAEKAGISWDEWAKANIADASSRSIQKAMALSQVKGIDAYAFLGLDRLHSIFEVSTKGGWFKGWKDDLVPKFVEHCGIQVGNDPADNYPVFIEAVDAAVNMVRLRNEAIEGIDPESVKEYTREHGALKRNQIKDLERVNDVGGDVQARLKELTSSKTGKSPKAADKSRKLKSKVNGLTKALKDALKDPEVLKGLDDETMKKLKVGVERLERKMTTKDEEVGTPPDPKE